MKVTELRKKTPQELEGMITDLLREQFNLRMQNGSGQLTKNSQLKLVRRDIARVKTILKEMASSTSS